VALLGAGIFAVLLSIGGGDDGGGKGGGGGVKKGPVDGDDAGAPEPAIDRVETAPHPGPVPILMYHVLAQAPPGAVDPELFVKADDFQDQMEWLDARGFVGVTLSDVFDAWFEGGELPEKPVVVTFDDGYRSHHYAALPFLEKLGWPAVLNLKVEALDQGELTEEQVGEMLDAGWEVASHTISHPDVAALSGTALEEELVGSKRQLERRLDTTVDFFCYPAGSYDDEAIEVLEGAGYLGATTTEPGMASSDEPFTLARIRVNGSDGLDGFVATMQAQGGA
jgi:peptidoglycan/xylan/chitin deacetylase (PgdA/CDA1 family)